MLLAMGAGLLCSMCVASSVPSSSEDSVVVPTEKLALVSFQENLKAFGDMQLHPEKHNLYKGLCAMALSLEEVVERQRRLEEQLAKVLRIVQAG